MNFKKSLTESQRLLRDALLEKSNRPLLTESEKLELEQYTMHQLILKNQDKNLQLSKILAEELLGIYTTYIDLMDDLFSDIVQFQNTCFDLPNDHEYFDNYSYDLSGNNCSYDLSGNNYSYDLSGNNYSYDLSGNSCSYDLSGNNCSYDLSGNNCSTNVASNSSYCQFCKKEQERLEMIYRKSMKLIEYPKYQKCHNESLFYDNHEDPYHSIFHFSANESGMSFTNKYDTKRQKHIKFGCNEIRVISEWYVSNSAINHHDQDEILNILLCPFLLDSLNDIDIPKYISAYLLALYTQTDRIKEFMNTKFNELNKITIIDESTQSNMKVIQLLIEQLTHVDIDGVRAAIEEVEDTKKLLSDLPSSVLSSKGHDYFRKVVKPFS